MRDRIRKPRRESRRLVSFLAFGVLLLAAWVFATNTIFAPRDTADSQAAPETGAIVAAPPQSNVWITRKADSLERLAPAAAAPSDAAVEEKAMPVPAPVKTAAADESLPIPTLTEGVEVAAVSPSMGGTETLLSPTLVSRSVEPVEPVVPLPSGRPRVAVIPLPRPRPVLLEEPPTNAGREITEAEIRRQQVY